MIYQISPHQAQEWLQQGQAILIDVREPEEFRAEHIAYACSLPLSQFHACMDQMEIPEERKVIMQCLGGARSANACAIAAERDLRRDIYNLEGGFKAWKESGLPVIQALD